MQKISALLCQGRNVHTYADIYIYLTVYLHIYKNHIAHADFAHMKKLIFFPYFLPLYFFLHICLTRTIDIICSIMCISSPVYSICIHVLQLCYYCVNCKVGQSQPVTVVNAIQTTTVILV